MKKIYTLIIVILFGCFIFSQAGYTQNVGLKTKIIINGMTIETDKNIQLVNEHVYVPASDVFKALGYMVEYDTDFKLVRAKKDENTIVIWTKGNSAKVNGKVLQMSESPLLVEGSVFVPLDFIKQSTGANVSWNADTLTVDILKKSDTVSAPERDVIEDQKVADRIAAEVNKTPAELMKLRTQEGNWQNVILNLVSEQKK
jgi:N-acetylmuramoyl-L-alanine amidase